MIELHKLKLKFIKVITNTVNINWVIGMNMEAGEMDFSTQDLL